MNVRFITDVLLYSCVVAQRPIIVIQYTAMLWLSALLSVYSIQLCRSSTPYYRCTVYSFVVAQRPIIGIQYTALLLPNAVAA
jgi:hypothetical protein